MFSTAVYVAGGVPSVMFLEIFTCSNRIVSPTAALTTPTNNRSVITTATKRMFTFSPSCMGAAAPYYSNAGR